jgi:hypothetical protein
LDVLNWFGTLRAFRLSMKTLSIFRFCTVLVLIFLVGATASAAHAQTEGIPIAILNAEIRAYKASFGISSTQDRDREWHPRAAFIRPRINSFTILAAGVYTANAMDMVKTQSSMPNFTERDPLARPLLLLPRPLYYASGVLMATGVNYFALRLRESPRFHKVWWLPQFISIGANLGGFVYTEENTSSVTSSSRKGRGH